MDLGICKAHGRLDGTIDMHVLHPHTSAILFFILGMMARNGHGQEVVEDGISSAYLAKRRKLEPIDDFGQERFV